MALSGGSSGFDLHGRRSYRWRCVSLLTSATVSTSFRRMLRGPRRPGWSWGFETSMQFLKAQGVYAAQIQDPTDSREFEDALASDFHDINAQWISTMFSLEATDREVLENPRATIIDPGGAILFVEAPGLGIVGTCALQRTGETSLELTKMGVRESARGLKAGEFLLHAAIARAKTLGANPLYLLTNKSCAAAIHLYEKLGFAHDAEIMARYGSRYQRCDVAMRYVQEPRADERRHAPNITKS